ncbi:MAG: glycosyltransferase family 4 protein [Burkholderiales bacterium]
MRVAFTLFGDDSWTGGINYLRNLLSALREVSSRDIELVLFVRPDVDLSATNILRSYLSGPPIVVEAWSRDPVSRIRRLLNLAFKFRDSASYEVFKREGIDLVFVNDSWYGFKFPIPTLAWIADFQHKHLPGMFSPLRRRKRDAAYWLLCRTATRVMVSSEDARRDCETYFKPAREKLCVVPFAVQVAPSVLESDLVALRAKYGLPSRFIYFPAQLWRHKNHLAVVEALDVLERNGKKVVVVCTGNPKDRRNPEYPKSVLESAKAKGLHDSFRFLGMIPYDDVLPLLRASVALLNPSLFEGWSTTVEEAKALGVPLVLSDIRVHREQAPPAARYFSPHDPSAIAEALWISFNNAQYDSATADSGRALVAYDERRRAFGEKFLAAAAQALTVRGLNS